MKSESNPGCAFNNLSESNAARINLCFIICYLAAVFLIQAVFSVQHAAEVHLSVKNSGSSEKILEPVISGVPFAKGILFDSKNISLLLNDNTEAPVQCSPAAFWPDGSIRWLHIRFLISIKPNESVQLRLQTGVAPKAITGILSEASGDSVVINTGKARFAFNTKEFKVNSIYFEAVKGTETYRAVPEKSKWEFEENGPLRTILKTEGNWYSGSTLLENSLLRFTARIFFFRDKDEIRLQLIFKNNNSFGWDAAQSGNPVTLSAVRFSKDLLPANGTYVFGQGTEKTWNIRLDKTNIPAFIETRYNKDGSVASGYDHPDLIAAASPSYYISTAAWGTISEIKNGFRQEIQQDFDRFEKMQKAKVDISSVENPPGLSGITLWEHLYQDIGSWCDYGDLTWGGDVGKFSGNHYDWSYSMFLQFFRTGYFPFLNAARLFARHEIDFDVYHTASDGKAFNFQKNWESRPSHESPNNDFGGGRPSHTWSQGYALMWLLTGELRGKDAFFEIQQGVNEYVYESFNDNGYINTSEIRYNGWLAENLINLWRIEPQKVLETPYGPRSIPQALKDILKNVFDRENEAGKEGFVVFGDDPSEKNLRSPLQNLYFLEPAIKAYSEVFKTSDAAYAAQLLGLIERMTSWIIKISYGNKTNAQGQYMPLQIPYWVNTGTVEQTEGQIPYLLMAANAAGFCYTETGRQEYLEYARKSFSDYVRYLGVVAGDSYVEDLALRTAASYNSNIYVDSESKIHGWSGRYGQYYLAAEKSASDVSSDAAGIQKYFRFELHQNYPNPFNPNTLISYQIPEISAVRLEVFDLLGRSVKVLVDEYQKPGNYQVNFDASALASGIYFYSIKAGDAVRTNRMVLAK